MKTGLAITIGLVLVASTTLASGQDLAAQVQFCLTRIADPVEDAAAWIDELDRLQLPEQRAVQIYTGLLSDPRAAVQMACNQRLQKLGSQSVAAVPVLCQLLLDCDGTTDAELVAAYLDTIRSIGPSTTEASETIVKFLAYRAPVYHGRDKVDVVRLRGYALVVLSEIGVPSSAVPLIVDALTNVDERLPPHEVGAAARAAGSLGPRAFVLLPYLTASLNHQFYVPEFSLERFDVKFPDVETTAVVMEVVRALGSIVTTRDAKLVEAIERAVKSADPKSKYYNRLVSESNKTLDKIRNSISSARGSPSDSDESIWQEKLR